MSDLVEVFREALMREHHGDWDMETISEAAHICARQLEQTNWFDEEPMPGAPAPELYRRVEGERE